MLNQDSEKVEQQQLKEYLKNLKNVLRTKRRKVTIVENDSTKGFLLYKQRIHYFADQCVAATGVQKPQIDLKINREDLDAFVEQSNKAFRLEYSRYRAAKMHSKMDSGTGALSSQMRNNHLSGPLQKSIALDSPLPVIPQGESPKQRPSSTTALRRASHVSTYADH